MTTPGTDPATPTGRGISTAIVGGVALVATIAFVVARHTLIDDTFITLSYARNVVQRGDWALVRGLTANSATSPLNVVVLGVVLAAVRAATWTVGIVFVGSTAVLAWALVRVARRLALPLWIAGAAALLVVLNPLLLSVLGMEGSTLGLTFAALLLLAAVERRPVLAGVALGLLLLTRLDFAVLAVPVVLLVPALRRAWLRVFGIALLMVVPWLVASWVWLGSAIPDTLAIKKAQSWTYSFLSGPLYYGQHDRGAVIVAFAPVALALAALGWFALSGRRARRGPGAAWGPVAVALGGILYWLSFVVLGPPPYLWYFVPTVAMLTVGGTVLLGAIRHRSGTPSASARRFLAVAAALLLLADLAVLVASSTRGWDRPAIVGNVASNADWQRIGRQVARRAGDEPVAVRGEIGALAYGCDCEVLDAFSDRGLDVPLVEDAIGESGALTRPVLRANYHRFDRSRLPVVPRWVLEDHDGAAHGRDEFGYTRLGDGSARHLTLRRSPADPAARAAVTRSVRRTVPRGRTLVLHTDWSGADGQVDAETWTATIAADLRHAGIPVALASAANRGDGTDLTVVTGDGVTTAFEQGTPEIVYFRGKTGARRRIELGTRRRRLERRHAAGKLSDVAFYTAMVRLQRQIDDDILVYRTRD